ncbi:MAG: hypothetical protein ABSF53_19315, partial [Terracidiphilus sp.]
FADQRLRHPDKPQDPSNRRISLIVGYLVKDNSEVPPPSAIKQFAASDSSGADPKAAVKGTDSKAADTKSADKK